MYIIDHTFVLLLRNTASIIGQFGLWWDSFEFGLNQDKSEYLLLLKIDNERACWVLVRDNRLGKVP